MNSTTDEPSAVDDATIVRGLQRGDREAWTALYDQYSSRVWRYAAQLVGGDATAVADVVQETFLAAAKGARQFDSARGTLWAWLAGITHNFVSLHWRQEARQSRHLAAAATKHQTTGASITPENGPQQLMEIGEQAELVRLVLSRLSADYALVLMAKYLDDLPPDELQATCGGTPEAVRSRLARARREFKADFERLAGADVGN